MLSRMLADGVSTTRDIMTSMQDANTTSRQRYVTNWRNALRRLPGFLEEDTLADVEMANDSDEWSENMRDPIVTVINYCYRNYTAWLARVLPRIRQIQAIASSREPQDLRAAFSIQKVLLSELLGHRGRHVDELLRLLSFVFCTHTGYVIVEGVVPKGKIYGDVRLVAYTPIDVYCFPGVRRLQASPAVLLIERLTKEEIEARWGDIPDTVSGASWPEDAGMEGLQPGIDQSLFEVKRLFIKPSKAFPNGAHRVILTGGEDEENKVWKTKHKDGGEWIGTPDKEYPIVAVGDIPMGYLDFGESRMNLIQGPQRIANVAYSRKVEAFLQLPIYTMSAPLGAGLTPDKVTNRTVSLVPVNPVAGAKASWEATQPATAADDMMGVAENIMNDLTAQAPVSRGQSQGSRMPVGTTAALIERSADQDAPLIERLKEGISVVGERIIIEGRNVWNPKKVFLVVGSHRKFEAVEFSKADLKNGFSVRIRPDDGMPKSMQERWDKVTKGQQAGVFGPSDAPDAGVKARKLLQILDDEEEFSLGYIDEQRAFEDFLLLKERRPAPVSKFSNHRVHLRAEAEQAVEEMTAMSAALPEELEVALWEHQQAHVLAQQEVNQLSAGLDQMPPPPEQEQPPPEEGAPGEEQPPEMDLPPEELTGPMPEELPPEMEGELRGVPREEIVGELPIG